MTAPDFPIRRRLERLLGAEALAYLLHLRPMEWPIMSAHFLLGTLLAVGWETFRSIGPWTTLGWFIFVVLLNGGTLAINSAFDQDEGDIGYLKQPPKPPQHLFGVSLGMLTLSLGLGFLLPPAFAWSNAACVALSVLYSVPPVRLKARAGWDLLVNCVGFGTLTPLAGWGLTGQALPSWFVLTTVGFGLLFGALYPTTQIYQIQEDRARGDRTLVIRLGEARSLDAALLFTALAHGAFAAAALLRGLPWLWMLPSFLVWSAVLLPWRLHWEAWSQRCHRAGMYWALAAWAVTDLSLLLLLWPR